MSTPVVSPRGIVVSIWGKAYIRGADGVWRPLKVGEMVKPSDQLLTEQNGIVQMEPADAVLQRVGTVPAEGVDRAIAALGTREGAPAAGLAGGDGGDLQPGLRVERIVEAVGAAPSVNGAESTPLTFGRAAASSGVPELDNPTPVAAGSSTVSAVEEGGAVDLGLGAPTGGGTLAVSVTQVPAIGQIVTAGGAVVTAGSLLTPTDVAGLRYLPPADYDGVAPVGGFAYTVSNGTSSAVGTVQITLAAVNDAPVATAGSATGAEDGALGISLGGTDVDGTVATVRVTTLPASGTLFLADGVTAVAANQALTPAQAASLVFRPNADFNGNATLAFTVTDNSGAVSSPATFTLAVTPVNDAPVANADTVSTVATAPVTLAVLANDRDVDGDLLRVTGASVPAAQGSVVVNADGSLTFTAAPGVFGPVAVGYTIADPSGATATGTMTVNVAGALVVTVDGPALSNDNTPLISGTSNAAPGSTVTLTVTGANGAVQTFTATVQSDGTYGASVPSALPDGAYSVGATLTVNGNSASANDGGSIDTTAPTIAVDAPPLGNDATPTISGTTNLPPGSTITLTVTGADGAVQTFTATVQPGGSYSADVPTALVQGPYTVVATGADAAGNIGSASDAGVLDTTPPTLTVEAPVLTNDTTPTISGTTDLPAGSTVTLTVTGADGVQQTFTAIVQPGGGFGADVPAPLAEGSFTVVARADDAAGNSASANDAGVLDATPPAATLALGPVTADDIVNAGEAGGTIAITGSVGGDVKLGDTVTLVVNGKSFSSTVQAGGTFSIAVPGADVLADADRRIDASVTTTDAAGNATTASAQRVYAVNAAPVAVADTASVAEDGPVATGDATPGTPGQDSDADGDALVVTGVAVGAVPAAAGNVGTALEGAYGALTLAADGTWTYTPGAAAQALGAGTSASDVFTYTIGDGRGGSATATLTVAVLGADDPTVIGGTQSGSVREDAVASAAGTLTATDADAGAVAFVPQSASGSFGGFTLAANGAWTYTLSNAAANVQALAEGQSVSETFVVATNTGASASITVTVVGSNDAPVAASATINAVEEGTAIALGLSAPTDLDNGALLTITVTGLPAIGQVQLADGTPVANGSTLTSTQLTGLRYLPPADYDGSSPVGSFTYSVTDGFGTVTATASVTLAAVDDAPVASNASAGTTENTVLASSVPAATDVDGTIASYALLSGPASGALTFNSDGTYSFNPGSAFDDLAAGATRQVSFTYTATDNNGGVS
ncbi:MAG TPA: Ig-like domain-containing protein, partial [Burkholderiaceae bacterium]|nr:Ig-like domain-containing protein [Burkholderiaceae bacterium]